MSSSLTRKIKRQHEFRRRKVVGERQANDPRIAAIRRHIFDGPVQVAYKGQYYEADVRGPIPVLLSDGRKVSVPLSAIVPR